MIGEGAPLWLVVVLSALGGGVVGTIATALVTWRLGVRGHEREARRDEHAAIDKLLQNAMARIEQMEKRDAALVSRMDELEARVRLGWDFIAALEHHIWQGYPPPPPPRPAGL